MRLLPVSGAVALLLAACSPEDRPVTSAPGDAATARVSFAPILPATPVTAPNTPAGLPAPPASIPGTLRLPPGEGRVPAVVVLHHSGGVDGRGALYAEALRRAGIATLEPDMWAARGIDRRQGVQQRPRSTLHTLPDVHGALRFLARHPRIDPERIGVMGMSWGAGNVVRLARADVQRAYAPEGPRFRSFASLYVACFWWSDHGPSAGEFDRDWPDGPLLMLEAEQEDYNAGPSREACEAMLARLPQSARSEVALHVYPGATHGWDRIAAPPSVSFFDPIAAGGRGGMVHIRADPAATADSVRRVTEFFTRTLAAAR